jgi:hypothetical protein
MERKFRFAKVYGAAGCMLGLLLTGLIPVQAHTLAPPSFYQSADKEITGTVRDAKGDPMPGVTVMIKNRNKGTQTNTGGHYRMQANTGDVLVFSFVG